MIADTQAMARSGFVVHRECTRRHSGAAAAARLEVAGSREIGTLAALLPEFTVVPLARRGGSRPAAIAAWCGMPGEAAARARATACGVPFLRLGEGLLRAQPGRVPAPLGVTALAIEGPPGAADLVSPERHLATTGWEEAALLDRARRLAGEMVARRLGGRWWDLDQGALPRRDGLVLLVLDEGSAMASAPAMLAAARAAHPARDIVVLGDAAGMARRAAAQGCTVIGGPVDRWAAIARADAVYTAGGETGFLALLAGRRVRCFASAFYTGWGITADAPAIAPRPRRRSVAEIFAACLLATRYLDPFRQLLCGFEDMLDFVAEWKRIEAANRGVAVLVGMSLWKRRRVAQFFRTGGRSPRFRRTTRGAVAAAQARGGAVAAWASRLPPGLSERAARNGVRVIRVEDGFIRSVGLGSDFLPALSLAVDGAGMYYDPNRPSDLETLLRETVFAERLLARAARLIDRLIAGGITKYNLGTAVPPLAVPAGRRIILVPGQVEDDLSVRLGGGAVAGNLDLLRRVRAAAPDAFILYKPHPDVEAGHRRGAVPDVTARAVADVVIRGAATAALLGQVDEVHTLTSLTGFEALLRRRRVLVYGRPFYAGWGLTQDEPGLSRGRKLALEELVAGALILYPRYLDPVTQLPCGPEIVIERLADRTLWRPGPLVVARRWQGALARHWRSAGMRLSTAGRAP